MRVALRRAEVNGRSAFGKSAMEDESARRGAGAGGRGISNGRWARCEMRDARCQMRDAGCGMRGERS
jgi:hypothetical protein